MNKSIITSLMMSVVAISAVIGGSIPMVIRINKLDAEITALKEKEPQKPYVFEVKDHYTAYQTSEVQEITHEPYLAFCKSGVNECYIEVPQGDTRTMLNLVYTGYEITYKVGGLLSKTVSNNGWALV